MISGFFRFLLGISRGAWNVSATQDRWASNWGSARIFLSLVFCILFAGAWLLGYPPSQVSAWLDAHLDGVMLLLWRVFWALVLLVCAISLFGLLEDLFGARAEEAKAVPRNYLGGGCMLLGLITLACLACVAITLN